MPGFSEFVRYNRIASERSGAAAAQGINSLAQLIMLLANQKEAKEEKQLRLDLIREEREARADERKFRRETEDARIAREKAQTELLQNKLDEAVSMLDERIKNVERTGENLEASTAGQIQQQALAMAQQVLPGIDQDLQVVESDLRSLSVDLQNAKNAVAANRFVLPEGTIRNPAVNAFIRAAAAEMVGDKLVPDPTLRDLVKRPAAEVVSFLNSTLSRARTLVKMKRQVMVEAGLEPPWTVDQEMNRIFESSNIVDPHSLNLIDEELRTAAFVGLESATGKTSGVANTEDFPAAILITDSRGRVNPNIAARAKRETLRRIDTQEKPTSFPEIQRQLMMAGEAMGANMNVIQTVINAIDPADVRRPAGEKIDELMNEFSKDIQRLLVNKDEEIDAQDIQAMPSFDRIVDAGIFASQTKLPLPGVGRDEARGSLDRSISERFDSHLSSVDGRKFLMMDDNQFKATMAADLYTRQQGMEFRDVFPNAPFPPGPSDVLSVPSLFEPASNAIGGSEFLDEFMRGLEANQNMGPKENNGQDGSEQPQAQPAGGGVNTQALARLIAVSSGEVPGDGKPAKKAKPGEPAPPPPPPSPMDSPEIAQLRAMIAKGAEVAPEDPLAGAEALLALEGILMGQQTSGAFSPSTEGLQSPAIQAPDLAAGGFGPP